MYKCDECENKKTKVFWSAEVQANLCKSCAKKLGVQLEKKSESDNEEDDGEDESYQLSRMGKMF